ncbi:glycoside hydrolase family 3 protein [Streptomyces clavifer]|uniref:beta-N-acetylhexosaminidase n=1 Tax=Streptomyces clavifer TaxID=68188 RepID=A0ABS4VBI4_9ACTN|nr:MULTISPECIES: glycoside hydrolase family 3 protein [Streptomyces]KQX78925.1 beta-N-acetylhexosaminidase [Streptomyces sp. Root1319]KQZ03730.1 beta-N-acetylhexosaminidase [Streptomyces sp. Root55]MBP2361280.1 beta-N-acetylhexosaminidase [Streptomyces clavifer]MDX2744335.1 glycoside hydrolase family 3 protein [Streptomyces sp. NRRL_B-2557]MDX3061911.1 glycoside hydrolase family 3 protein [Streptomyces sp. ND04-05B]
MHHRTSRRTLLTATAVTAAAAATGVVAVPGAARAAGTSTDSRLKRLIARMSLEEKVGQLFVMRVYGHSATAPDQADIDANLDEIGVRTAAELIARYHVGGIIYFAWAHNTRDPQQIAGLSNGIQRAGLAGPTPVPLLISTDQEHGIVCRVGEPATLLPGAMALGAGGSRSAARAAGRIAGAELAAVGIRQNYAPVADVNVNPANPVIGVRSFGSDPDAVAGMVAAQVKGYQGAGIAATAKHFPGHGDTSTDSHTGLPYIHHTREQWAELDAPPFRAAVAAGIDSIMTAHIVVPALDPSEDPATLSHPILTGILREELGYDGVVVTDALGMEGVRTKYGDERVPVLALLAGVDQLLNPPDLSVAWNAVLQAVKSGEISVARIEESILRILRLKTKLGLFRDPYVTARGVDRTVGVRAHLAAADRIAEHTTTLLANNGALLPLSRRSHRNLLVVGADPASPSGTTGPPTTTLAEAFGELGFTATALSTGTAPSPAKIAEAVAAARDKDAVVVGTYNVSATSSQRTLVGALAATGVPVVTVAIRNPYDIAHLAGTGYTASLAAYSWTDVELRAAARVIAGRADPEGRLPVPVQRADTPTQTLYPVGYGLSYRTYA